jgi:KDO2-lipid IV(A) lauroyltransferase
LKWRSLQLLALAVRLAPGPSLALYPLAGELARLISVRRRRAVAANVGALLPTASTCERDRISRSIFRSVAHYYVEIFRLPARDIQELHGRIAVEGYGHFIEAQRAGKGVIVASIHLGPAEIVLQAFAARGVRFTAMVERLRPAPLYRLVQSTRHAHGHRYVDASLSGTKALIRTLREGGTVAMLVDRDVLGTGITVEYAGGRAAVPAGVIELARLTGAAIVPAHALWLPGHRYAATIRPAMYPITRAKDRASLRRELMRLLAPFEARLREHPEQWLLLERLAPRPDVPNAGRYTELRDD